MLKIDTILYPTDFSESAKAAFHLACSLARDHGAKVIALHVVPTPLASVSTALQQQDPAFRESLMEQLKDDFTAEGVEVIHHMRDGEPGEEVLRYADEVNADLIVMGTHGRGGVWRMVMGSVAEEVSRHAKCPVLTVRHPVAQAEADSAAGKAK